MTTSMHFRLFFVLAIFTAFSITAFALIGRNICRECGKIAAADATVCPNCGIPFNLCLDCNTLNPADKDYCTHCSAPLATMRVLSSIPEDQRALLRLGQSKRAVVEKELEKIDYLLKKPDADSENLFYVKGKLLNSIDFHSMESQTWREFLKLFPNSEKVDMVKKFLSDSLRKWAYLLYSSKETKTALALLKESTEMNSTNTEAWEWIGRIQLESENNKEASHAYMQALKLQPGNKTAIHFLRTLKTPIPKELLKSNK